MMLPLHHHLPYTPPLPPMVQVATRHVGITGVMWPITNDNDMSLAPLHATHTAPCHLPPPLSRAAAAATLCATAASLTHHCQPHPPLPASPTAASLTHHCQPHPLLPASPTAITTTPPHATPQHPPTMVAPPTSLSHT